MNIWTTRGSSELLLEGPLAKEREILATLFDMIEQQVRALERIQSSLPRAAAALLGKAHRLSIGVYSLQLDALGQESGALLRPLQEVSEILTYLVQDPDRVIEVEEGRLPKAGVIAQRIDGNLKGVRDHLSAHASHFSATPESVVHYLDFERGTVVLDREASEELLGRNLRSLSAFMVMCAVNGAMVMEHSGLEGEALVSRLQVIRDDLVARQAGDIAETPPNKR